MKRAFRIPTLFISILMLLAIVLSACVRPIPDREEGTTDAAPTTEAPLVQPTTPAEEGAAPGTAPYPAGEQPTAEAPAEQPTAEAPPEAQPTPVPTAVSGDTVHVVQAGETLFRIAQRYGVTVEEIAVANNIANVNVLEVGQQLFIPAPGSVDVSPPADQSSGVERTHVVQPGENLFRIGLRYGFTVQELASYNNIPDPARIAVGQVIRIPPSN